MGNLWNKLRRAIVGVFAAGQTAWAQPSITVESPPPNAVFPEFSSPVLKVRVENGDGTLRYFAENPLNDTDLLLSTNVGVNATHEVHLTNLPPGNYNIPVTTRGEGDNYATNFIRFSVTNRWRSGPTFTAVILPGTNTIPVSINNLGQIVGTSNGKAFLYDGEMHSLGTLGDPYTEATAINNKGQVVGVTYETGGTRHGFLWDAQNGLQRLPIDGSPTDINDNGDIIGVGAGSFLYRNGTLSSVPGSAWDISNDGLIAQGDFGIYDAQPDSRQAWNEFLRLGRPNADIEVGTIRAIAINDAHEVTGEESASIAGARYPSVYAFRYSGYRRERITSRGTMASVRGINILGDIVGWSTVVTYGPRGTIASETSPRAFIFPRTGNSGDINRFIPNRGDFTIAKAFSINDRREIVGIGEINGEQRGVLLRPLPQFQSIEFDAAAGKIKARVEGFISMRIKAETSTNLRDWNFHSAQELTDAPLEIVTPADGSSIYFRLSSD